jgi:hypothetical protein
MPITLKFFQKIEKKETLLNSFLETTRITSVPKIDKDNTRKEDNRAICL